MANKIALGIETDDPKNYQTKLNNREKKVVETAREDNNIVETFPNAFSMAHINNVDGTVYTGAAGEEIGFYTGKNAFECHQAAVATPAVITPFQSAEGLEVNPVGVADALEITNGTTDLSKAAYTVGSFDDNSKTIFFEANINIDDISSVTELAVGFRKTEAYQAAVNSYNTYATFNIGGAAAGRIDIETELNGAGLATTDTTEADVADGEALRLRIEVTNGGVCKFFLSQTASDSAAAALLTLAEPTVTATFTFDDTDVIIPFLFLDCETADPGVSVSRWEVGYK